MNKVLAIASEVVAPFTNRFAVLIPHSKRFRSNLKLTQLCEQVVTPSNGGPILPQ